MTGYVITVALCGMVLCSGLTESRRQRNGVMARRSEEELLLQYLFKHYNPSARPVIASNKTVPVSIMFSLMQLQELNVRNQILTATGLLILEWKDERLRWEDTNFDIQEIVIEARNLWVPEFAVINGPYKSCIHIVRHKRHCFSAEEIYGDFKDFRALIKRSGVVHWEPGGVFKTMCQIDITYFPFDDQHCRLIFGAWSYHTTKMNLTNVTDTVNLDSYEKNGEWDIVGTSVERREFFFECCPDERFSNVAFIVHMRRRYTFYVMNVILPSMVTSILLLSIFYCPPAQKVQIGVVVLLSFRIFLLNVTDSIPKTSDHMPLLGIYLTCTMAITTLSMVLTVFVLNLHAMSERPVPYAIRLIIIHYLARVFCKGNEAREFIKKECRSNKSHSRVKKKPSTTYTPMSGLQEDFAEEPSPLIVRQNGGLSRHNSSAMQNDTSFVMMHDKNGTAKSRYYSHNSFKSKSPSSCDTEAEKPDYSKEWQLLAEVVDRIFFWSFLLSIIAVTLVLFHPLTVSSNT